MGSACKFLVIDDNEIDRLITSRLLTSGGMTDVHTVNGGLEGIDWIKKHVNNIGQKLVVLVDIMMPGMDGFQFMEAFETLDASIKQVVQVFMLSSTLDPETLDASIKQVVQVFMLSSTLDPRDIKRAASNKTVKELLSKPLPVAKLSAAVQEIEMVRT